MPDVFINYRTGEAKDTAYRIHEELSRRFGKERVFLAGESIEPGERYANTLIESVRRSGAILALIGQTWLDAPSRERSEGRALDDQSDWVRRELEEAFAWAVPVVPVLIGRQAEQLDPQRLPETILDLAECQYIRYSPRNAQQDLATLGDRLAKLVPALAAVDKGRRPEPTPPPTAGPGSFTNNDQSGGISIGHSGDIGTLVGESNGPLNTGPGSQILGDQINGDQVTGNQVNGGEFSGDGTNFQSGDNRNGIQQQFGPLRRRQPKARDEQ